MLPQFLELELYARNIAEYLFSVTLTLRLKGAMLFLLWKQHGHRPTRDINLLGFGEHSISSFGRGFLDCLRHSLPQRWPGVSPRISSGRLDQEDDEYEGVSIVAAGLAGRGPYLFANRHWFR